MNFSVIQAKYHGLDNNPSAQCAGNIAMIYALYTFVAKIHHLPPATRYIDGRDTALQFMTWRYVHPTYIFTERLVRGEHYNRAARKWCTADFLDLSRYGAQSYHGLPEQAFKKYSYTDGVYTRSNTRMWTCIVIGNGGYFISEDETATYYYGDGRTRNVELEPIFEPDYMFFARAQDSDDESSVSVVYNQNRIYNHYRTYLCYYECEPLLGNRTFIIQKEKWNDFVLAMMYELANYKL